MFSFSCIFLLIAYFKEFLSPKFLNLSFSPFIRSPFYNFNRLLLLMHPHYQYIPLQPGFQFVFSLRACERAHAYACARACVCEHEGVRARWGACGCVRVSARVCIHVRLGACVCGCLCVRACVGMLL